MKHVNTFLIFFYKLLKNNESAWYNTRYIFLMDNIIVLMN